MDVSTGLFGYGTMGVYTEGTDPSKVKTRSKVIRINNVEAIATMLWFHSVTNIVFIILKFHQLTNSCNIVELLNDNIICRVIKVLNQFHSKYPGADLWYQCCAWEKLPYPL